MDETLRQVGQLLLGAIPTAVLLIVLCIIYEFVLRRPLANVLEQRRERTEGAVAKARADLSAAEAKTHEYEQKLRDARLTIFKGQEAKRQAAQQARSEAISEARGQAEQQIREAKTAIEQDMAAARNSLQAEAERLAGEIIRTILKPAATAPAMGGQA